MWLNRQQLAELFGRDVKTIGKHINNALKEELNDASSVVAKFAATAAEGKDYQACFGARRSRKRNKGRNPCITARALFVFVNIKYESPLVTLLLPFDLHSLSSYKINGARMHWIFLTQRTRRSERVKICGDLRNL